MFNIIEAITEGRKGIGIFAAGLLAGTAGIRILTSEDAIISPSREASSWKPSPRLTSSSSIRPER